MAPKGMFSRLWLAQDYWQSGVGGFSLKPRCVTIGWLLLALNLWLSGVGGLSLNSRFVSMDGLWLALNHQYSCWMFHLEFPLFILWSALTPLFLNLLASLPSIHITSYMFYPRSSFLLSIVISCIFCVFIYIILYYNIPTPNYITLTSFHVDY